MRRSQVVPRRGSATRTLSPVAAQLEGPGSANSAGGVRESALLDNTIVAYCIPITDEAQATAGCLIKMSVPDAASTVVLRLKSNTGERIGETFMLIRGQTHVTEYVFVKGEPLLTPRFNGTVEYENYPERTWQVLAADPEMQTLGIHRFFDAPLDADVIRTTSSVFAYERGWVTLTSF